MPWRPLAETAPSSVSPSSARGTSWCAGVDVGDHKPEIVDKMIATFGNRSFEIIETIEVPQVAAVHGACVGGGMEYAIACDRSSPPKGRLRPTRGAAGISAALRRHPPAGAGRSRPKPSRCAPAAASMQRRDAQRMGFVSQVVAVDAFDETVDKLLNDLQGQQPPDPATEQAGGQTALSGMPDFGQALSAVGDLFLNILMKTEDTALRESPVSTKSANPGRKNR